MTDGGTCRGGALFYLMGPSGAGKDSLLALLHERLSPDELLLPRRYITRPAGAGGEAHHPLAESEFTRREAAGAFVLSWRSHGLRYGIGREVADALAAGRAVLVNGSRGYLDEARRRVPCLVPVALDAADATLAERLRRRGREGEEEIAARLERARRLRNVLPGDARRIRNDGCLDDAASALHALILAHRGARSPQCG